MIDHEIGSRGQPGLGIGKAFETGALDRLLLFGSLPAMSSEPRVAD